ncbi:SRPBCC family protein [Alicyclobacillus sp. SO9]|uniref:SRPBCC family protein n=1 Tax=Alicyclobacillus sp. SO9 TaxID=2665646 RepID=UPI0018E7D6A0|nr:SRPBCC family protein [Alicyclobacillus sp. SO9]QQE78403.1 SRPBCC family protein [Alicyclobacillus sp. SO9]
MATSETIQIKVPWQQVWNTICDVTKWPMWNGALQEVRETENLNEFSVRVRGLGWVRCRVVNQDRNKQYFQYQLSGKGNQETGTIELKKDSEQTTVVVYTTEHRGWLRKIVPLESMSSWRIGRLKELCETNRVFNINGPGFAHESI